MGELAIALSEGDKLLVIVQVSVVITPCVISAPCLGVCLPELGLESQSRWTMPLGSGVGGERMSEGASQDRVDQRELLPLPDERLTAPSPGLLPQSSGLL